MTYPWYIVAGGGRTGSHWVEQVISFVTDYPLHFEHPKPDDRNCMVYHTNNIKDLVALPDNIKASGCLVFTKRKDLFAQSISLAVAQHSDEWFFYSNRDIPKFEIDTQKFCDMVRLNESWNNDFNEQVRPLFSTVVDIEFEDLVSNHDCVEDYVSQKIGVQNTQGSALWDLNRNPRIYHEIITNWNDLVETYQNLDVSAH